MAKRQKYAVWSKDAVKTVIDYANSRKDNNLRMNWQECAELVEKTPRECFDLYRNRVVKKEKHSFSYDSASSASNSSSIIEEQIVQPLDFKPFECMQDDFEFLVFEEFE